MPELQYLSAVAATIGQADEAGARSAVEAALKAGWPPAEILAQGIGKPLFASARQFEAGRRPAPQLMLTVRAVQAALRVLPAEGRNVPGTAAVCTLKDDPHLTGVAIMTVLLETLGFRVLELGACVSKETVVQACRAQCCTAAIVSIHMVGVLPEAAQLVRELHKLSPPPVVNIGGPPVSAAWAAGHEVDVFAAGAADSAEAVLSAVFARYGDAVRSA